MKRLTSKDVKELNLLKHYRIIRKWAAKTNSLKEKEDRKLATVRLILL